VSDQSQYSRNAQIQWSRVFGASMASEARVAYSRFLFANLTPAYMYGVRTYSFPGLAVGAASNQPNSYWSDTYQFRYDLSWFRGNHDIKAGGEFLRVHDHGYWFNVAFGTLAFNSRPPDLNRRFPAEA